MSSQKKFRARLSEDGTVATLKVGAKSLSISELYHWLITISWIKFYTVLTITYVAITSFFTIAYLLLDLQNVKGIDPTNFIESTWRLFFFSAQTLSMVGGVGLAPEGAINHFILTTESMTALSLLTLITGLLFARFSKQTAALKYSDKALVAPHKNGSSEKDFMQILPQASESVQIYQKTVRHSGPPVYKKSTPSSPQDGVFLFGNFVCDF